MTGPRMGIIGIDHRHIYTMAGHMVSAGADLAGWYTDGTPGTLDGFLRRFPKAPRAQDIDGLLDDPTIDLILIAGIPSDRAELACRAMRAGKDVMTDKPGCLTLDALSAIRQTVAETGRIWSVDFSERFEVPAVTRATELVADGAIGDVLQTLGIGPHRLNAPTRPDWFFDPSRNGGILIDIGSHQIDQFLHFTGKTDAEIAFADIQCTITPGFQDFGQIALRSGTCHGYIRVDWFTPDALPTWGDGRLFIQGTKGYIELRKYVDIGGSTGTDHVLLVTEDRCERIDARGADLPYFARFVNDLRDRTETAMTQAHAFKVMELAIRAQHIAEGAPR
ncbi:MAG: Gfo/Idh/MocA family oxidoreductase [Pseudomonadota bacterium]